MFVTHAFQIPFEKELYEELRSMQREAATVWNDIVREATSYYFTWEKWLSKSEIQAIRKQTYNLHSQTVQAAAWSPLIVGYPVHCLPHTLPPVTCARCRPLATAPERHGAKVIG